MGNCRGSKSPTVRSQMTRPPARSVRISEAIFRISEPTSMAALLDTRPRGCGPASRARVVRSATVLSTRALAMSSLCHKAAGQGRRPGGISRGSERQGELRRRRARSGALAAFEVEQETLELEAAAVAGERAVGADDAVAGDDHGDRVAPVGAADGAACRGASDRLGDLGVGPGLAVGDGDQGLPDAALESGAVRRQRQGELAAPAGEVLGELLPD